MQNLSDILNRLQQLKSELLEIELLSTDDSITEQHRLKTIRERIHAITMSLR